MLIREALLQSQAARAGLNGCARARRNTRRRRETILAEPVPMVGHTRVDAREVPEVRAPRRPASTANTPTDNTLHHHVIELRHEQGAARVTLARVLAVNRRHAIHIQL